MTSGLVGEMGFKVLPDIAPWVTLLVTALSMMVSGCGRWPAHSLTLDHVNFQHLTFTIGANFSRINIGTMVDHTHFIATTPT